MALEPNHPRNQHYVPQFLLRNFANDKEQMYVFDKSNDKSFLSSTRNVAAEAWFYDFQDASGEPHSLEYFMRDLESAASVIVNGILSKQSLGHLSDEDRLNLSIFTAVQQLRVKGVRDQVKTTNESLRQALRDRGGDPDIFFPEMSAEEIKQSALDQINMAIETAPYINNKSWMLQRAPAGKRFYISDNPVTLNNRKTDDIVGNLGCSVMGSRFTYHSARS